MSAKPRYIGIVERNRTYQGFPADERDCRRVKDWQLL